MKTFDAEHTMRVFVSGSSALTELTPEMMNALDDMMAKRAQFLIGDCYGADELAQRYLKAKGYEDVIVYCSQEKPHARRTCYDRVKSLWDKAKGNRRIEDITELLKQKGEDVDGSISIQHDKELLEMFKWVEAHKDRYFYGTYC